MDKEFKKFLEIELVLLFILIFGGFFPGDVKSENSFDDEIQIEEDEDITVLQTIDVSELKNDTNSPGIPKKYKQVVKVKATAYCLCKKCCGKSPSDPYYGVTASGLRIVPNTGMKVIAIDPRMFKLGSKVYVESLDGSKDYGNAIAADTGGGIKGNHIDLYMDTHEEALKWGVRYVNLYIL